MADRSIKVRLEAEVGAYKQGMDAAAKATERAAAAAELAEKNVAVAAAKQVTSARQVEAAQKNLARVRESGKASALQVAQAEQKVAEAERQATVAAGGLRDATAKLEAAQKASAAQAERQSSVFGRASDSIRRNADDLAEAGKLMATFGGAITAAGAAALKTGIEYNTLQQTSRAALKTMLGDAEAVNGQMEKLDAFAKTSPFSKQTFISAQQQMLAFGIEAEKVVPYLSAINDAVAAAGGNSQMLGEVAFVMAQISAAGKITGQDLIQFGQRGINAAELIGQSMGKTGAQIRSDITAGALDANTALDALAQGMSSEFAGASANVKDTMTGALDRVKAAWRDLGSELADPLVGADGGGFLVDLANNAADAARAFQTLPDPIKATVAAAAGLTGLGLLGAGSFLIAAPRILETRAALQRLAVVMPKTTRAMKAMSVAAGVAGAALTALMIASSWDGGETTQGMEEIKDGLKQLADGATTVETVFKNMDGGNLWSGFTKDFQGALDVMADKSVWATIDRNIAGFGATVEGWLPWVDDGRSNLQKQIADIEAYGETLASLASSDLPTVQGAFKAMNDELGGGSESAQQLLTAMPGLKDALIGVASEAGYATNETTLLKIAVGDLKVQTDGAASATRSAADVYDDAVASLQAEADAANAAADAILRKAQAASDSISAEIRFQESIDSARASIAETGKATDLSTEAGRSNMEALLGVADSAVAAAEALRDTGASQEEINGKLAAGQKAFESLALKAGFSSGEVRKLSQQLGLVPGTVRVEAQVNTAAALSAVQRLNATLNSINGKTVTAAVAIKQYGQAAMADGGVRERANGALDEPQIRPGSGAGVTQVSRFGPVTWAEGETEWEAFIPGARSKRPRALAIWEETGRRLGAFEALGAESFAAGGLRSSASLRTAERRVKRLASQVRSSRRSGNDKRTRKLEDQLRDARSALADLREARVDLALDARRGRLSEQASGGLSSAYSLVDQVRDAAGDSALTKGTRKSLSSVAKSSEVAFRKLYATAERVEVALEKARDHLQEMQQISDGLKSSLSGGFRLTDAYTQWSDGLGNVAGKSITAAGMVSGGKAYADKLKKFGASIKKLADFGLSSVVLQEIAALGPDEGLEVANQLLAGGKKSVQELNGVYTSIASASGFIGDQATRNYRAADGTFYAGGVGQAQGRVDSLEKSMSKIEASIGKWGDKIARILGKAYGVKMASGGWVTGGIKGVDSVPLTAMPDEYVVNAKAASQYGPLLESINSGRGLPVLTSAYPAQTNVNVALDKGSLAGALDGVGVTMLVDGKPMKATIRTEMNAAFSAAGRGY